MAHCAVIFAIAQLSCLSSSQNSWHSKVICVMFIKSTATFSAQVWLPTGGQYRPISALQTDCIWCCSNSEYRASRSRTQPGNCSSGAPTCVRFSLTSNSVFLAASWSVLVAETLTFSVDFCTDRTYRHLGDKTFRRHRFGRQGIGRR